MHNAVGVFFLLHTCIQINENDEKINTSWSFNECKNKGKTKI